eukprot:TRINITY_DN7968_c0_g1_i1.p1 TRINITY_DN7968_c0_g1~~TRINITY_DN7968_c0_g1_i1.p1  ORF type:complete len:596 (-),score=210.33 TRINITY_DN7968_c0_g1_i1:178-1965(-)
MRILFASAALAVALFLGAAQACTNLLVSKGASADGSVIVAYNADDLDLFGSVSLYPAANHSANATRQTWDWDGQFYLGEIAEAAYTRNVVGNINDAGLIIGETTFGGLDELDGHGYGWRMDYGSLIWVTLQRASTAREAISIMDQLCTQYGYGSSGESFAIGDPNEVWLMELIGKGNETGAVWVATRVPEGHVTATANQARTLTFDQNDPDNVLFAPDVISFARQRGLYPQDAPDADFSFADVYDPISFGGARFCEARVWNVLNPASGGALDSYLDYAQGYNLTNRMPLTVQVAQLLSVNDTMSLMRTHGENTWFDNSGMIRPDLGAGPGYSNYRFRPLAWTWNGSNYLNERTVGAQQTGWAFVAQSRSWMPPSLAAVMYFAPDDSSTSPRVPFYACLTRLPASFGDRAGQLPGAGVPYAPVADGLTMSLDSAFWVWNMVGQYAQGERASDAVPLILEAVNTYQQRFFEEVAGVDKAASVLLESDPAAAVEFVTSYVETAGQQMTKDWLQFWMFLFSRFRDGATMTPSALPQCQGGQTQGCLARPMPTVDEQGYSDQWYQRIVNDSDNRQHFALPSDERSDRLFQRKLEVLRRKL